MPTGIKEGIGATLGFGTSSVTINLVDVNLDGVSVEDIPTFDQSTTGYKTYVSSTLAEGGTVSFKVNWNLYDSVALEGAKGVAQTMTVTLPKPVSGDTTAPSYSFPGYLKSFSITNTIGTLVEGSCVIKVAGDLTPVNGAA
jgi:hypothetical protein